jgi:hypothetical protein
MESIEPYYGRNPFTGEDWQYTENSFTDKYGIKHLLAHLDEGLKECETASDIRECLEKAWGALNAMDQRRNAEKLAEWTRLSYNGLKKPHSESWAHACDNLDENDFCDAGAGTDSGICTSEPTHDDPRRLRCYG